MTPARVTALLIRGLRVGATAFGVVVALLGGASAVLVAVFWGAGCAAVLLWDRMVERRRRRAAAADRVAGVPEEPAQCEPALGDLALAFARHLVRRMTGRSGSPEATSAPEPVAVPAVADFPSAEPPAAPPKRTRRKGDGTPRPRASRRRAAVAPGEDAVQGGGDGLVSAPTDPESAVGVAADREVPNAVTV